MDLNSPDDIQRGESDLWKSKSIHILMNPPQKSWNMNKKKQRQQDTIITK
jgi:hypothetical protein